MAKGRSNGTGLWLLFGVILYTVLVLTGVVDNPLPGAWEWIDRDQPLAEDLRWQERLGGRPSSVVAAGNALAVDLGTEVQLRSRLTGRVIRSGFEETLQADWMAVAGDGSEAVVVTGTLLEKGYEVRNPLGQVIRRDEEAVAVWTFRDLLLDARCAEPRECELRAYRPGSGEPVWTTNLPGVGAGLFANNPDLAGGRRVTPRGIDEAVSGPEPAPPVVGFPTDGRVIVVETANGQVLQHLQPERNEQLSVIGGRIISSVAASRDGICVVAVTGLDAATGLPVWGPEPYHLRTVSGAGCEQRDRPVAAGSALVAVTADGRELVVDAYDGRVLWTGAEGERVESLSAAYAVIRAADPTTRRLVALGGSATSLWDRTVHADASMVVTRCGVVLRDREPDRVVLLDPDTGAEQLSLRTDARVRACVPEGLLIGDGRSVGYARAGVDG